MSHAPGGSIRLLPTLTRFYPRRFTFYLAHPIRSILFQVFY